jgi:uncharacterized membrane protein
VVKYHENGLVIGAFTLDNIPAGMVIVYVVFSVKLACVTVTMVLLADHVKSGSMTEGFPILNMFSTELVFIETVKMMMIGASSGTSSPFGKYSNSLGKMKVVKFQKNGSVMGAFTLDNIPAGTDTLYVVFSVKLACMMVNDLLSEDQEYDTDDRAGTYARAVSTDVLSMGTLKLIRMGVASGISTSFGEYTKSFGKMKVVKFHITSLFIGAPTADNAPARTVTVYVVFSVRLTNGVMVMVLLSGDQPIAQETAGEKDKESFTDALSIDMLNEMTILVLRGMSGPMGE